MEDSLIGDFFPTSKFNIHKDKKKKKLNWESPQVQNLENLLNSAKESLQTKVGSDYKVSSSVGQKPLEIAWSPWIGIHSKRKGFDAKAKTGIYLTILWKVDGSGVCVSLQTGVDKKTSIKEIKEIRPKALGIRKNYNIDSFSENIDLASSYIKQSKKPRPRPWQYEQANIEGKEYDLNSLSEISSDIDLFLENYENLIQKKLNRIKLKEEITIEEVHQEKLPEKSKSALSSKWKTNRNIRNKALEIAGRKCEFDSSHSTFKDSNGNTFMEGHHLIPLEYQDLFTQSLDFLENIVSLCPTCHREIHHAEPRRRKEIASILFQKRNQQLNKVLEINLTQLSSFYEENLEFADY